METAGGAGRCPQSKRLQGPSDVLHKSGSCRDEQISCPENGQVGLLVRSPVMYLAKKLWHAVTKASKHFSISSIRLAVPPRDQRDLSRIGHENVVTKFPQQS